MIGGMEVLADNFAVHFTNLGHSVVLVTPVAAEEPDEAIYSIVRQPSKVDFFRLVQNADIIFSNGANLYSAVYSILTQKPVIMRHTGYQISAIDGLGWHKGKPAPLRPTASVIHHVKNSNLISTIKGTLKLVFLRLYAKKFVSVNVAIYKNILYNMVIRFYVDIKADLSLNEKATILVQDANGFVYILLFAPVIIHKVSI